MIQKVLFRTVDKLLKYLPVHNFVHFIYIYIINYLKVEEESILFCLSEYLRSENQLTEEDQAIKYFSYWLLRVISINAKIHLFFPSFP